ncbi:hypothetical protein Tco_0026236 [Tanacetum coccineum]
MLIQPQAVEGEGSGQPTKPQHTPTIASPSNIEPIPIIASSSHPKKTHKHRKTKIKAIEISQSSRPTTLVADETVHGERGDSVERVATTTASLDAEQDSGNIIRTQSMATLNELIPQGTGSGSGPRILALENIKTAQDLEIINLKKRVKKLEKKKKARTPQLKRRLFKVWIESSGDKSLEDVSKTWRNDIDQDKGFSWFQEDGRDSVGGMVHDEVTTASVPSNVDVSAASPTRPVDDSTTNDITLAETLMKIKSSASRSQKDKGVMFKEPTEPTTTSRPQPHISAKDKGKGIMQEPEKPVKVKGKDQIEYDADVAQRLQVELDEEARLEREREEEASNAALIKEWDSIEATIDADRQLAEQLQAQEREELTVEEQSKLLAEFIETRRKYFVAKRAKENKNKPPTKTQQRCLMCTYLKHMEGYKHKDFKGKIFDAIKKMFDKACKRSKQTLIKEERSLNNNSFLGEYECSSLALDREERRDEKKRLDHLKQDQTMLMIKIFSDRKKVFRERKKTRKIHAKRSIVMFLVFFDLDVCGVKVQIIAASYDTVLASCQQSTLCVRKYYVSELSFCAGSELGSELTFLAGSELRTSELKTSEYRFLKIFILASYGWELYIQCAGSDTRPPMLDRTDFASWQQRIRLYCQGKENGVNILKSIDEGPFQMGTFWETLAEGTEGALHLGHMGQCEDAPGRFAKLINDMWNIKMTMSRMQLNSKFVNNMVPEWGKVGYGGAHNRVGNANLGQASHVKCYNYNAQENGVALDEEQLLFIAGRQDNAIDEDVDEQPVQDLALNVDNVFQPNDCDAFDFDVDKAPTTQTMFMANLSSAYLVYDETSPSYDSDILSEVHDHDHYQDVVCEHHEEHEMHDDA